MEEFKIIAFTHKSLSLEDIGVLHVEEEQLETRLSALKITMNLPELMYLSTCNRVEFLLKLKQDITPDYISKFIDNFLIDGNSEFVEKISSKAEVYENVDALDHMFTVASSLDSLVVGEREIITQVRNAFEKCRDLGFTGDLLRMVIQKTIETGKEVYSNTDIAKKPVSVVSLAYRKLKELQVNIGSRILIIGAGQTNSSMGKYLKKHGFTNLTVFSRTLEKAKTLAADLSGNAFGLDALPNYRKGFDVIISCTGSAEFIITKDNYELLLNGELSTKIVIDLAIPNDFDSSIQEDFKVNLIAINNLKSIAEENLKERKGELVHCQKIIKRNIEDFIGVLKERKVELAMQKIPAKVKEIREAALNGVFAKELKELDDKSRETLDKVISYMEKKYISVPMKMAKEVFLGKSPSDE
ncbi:MAG: glutamyl-tRNA reductase [Bacteroidetes bacterium]|nr:MAG: glutamyl-tRNA reductase [Bacteroidota bacterium]